jgi:hypothetical protein
MHSNGVDIILDAPYMEAYIPMYYFDKAGFAVDKGNMVTTFGVFEVAFFENGKVVENKTVNIPSWIDLYCPDFEIRNMSFPHVADMNYKVIKFFKGNKVMASGFVQDSNNAVTFLDFIIYGKLPTSVPYSKLLEMWYKNQDMNSVSFGVPSVILELILSVSCRDKNDPTRKYCESAGLPGSGLTDWDYMMSSVRSICQYSSTFQSLTFEDIDSMITSSLNRTRRGIADPPTPVEAVIKM